jgi:hypothetical protein
MRRITYVRSVVTPATVQAAHALSMCQGRGGVYYAGAYTLDQVPLQEQAVRSGVKVSPYALYSMHRIAYYLVIVHVEQVCSSFGSSLQMAP